MLGAEGRNESEEGPTRRATGPLPVSSLMQLSPPLSSVRCPEQAHFYGHLGAGLCLGLAVAGCSDAPVGLASRAATTEPLTSVLVGFDEAGPECGQPFTPLFEIQGAGAVTSWRDAPVVTEGVVVGEFLGAARLGGFFLQDPVGDGDPVTSDGIFVSVGDASELELHVGDRLRIVGVARELFGQTEIADVQEIQWCGRGEVAPSLLRLSALEADLESYVGMLVRIEQPLTLTGSQDLGRYGELWLSVDGRLFHSDGAQAPPNVLVVDDGSRAIQPRPVPHLPAEGSLRLGDVVPSIEGALGFAFGSFRLHPTQPLEVIHQNPRPAPPPPPHDHLRIAAFNLGNYFSTLGLRGARTSVELAVQRAQLVLVLAALDADIVGVAELENDGGRAGEDLVSDLNTHLGKETYAQVRTVGAGGDAIRVGMIYKPDRVTRLGPPLYSTDPVHVRPPLAQTFRWGSRRLTVVVAHFKSKSCTGASGPDRDRGDGAGCFGHRRLQEADAALGFLRLLQRRAGDSAVLLVGDLNADIDEASLQRLGSRGLVSLLHAGLPGPSDAARPYSYAFDGHAGLFDHVWATPGVAAYAVHGGIWHINADEPPVLRDLVVEAAETGDPVNLDVYRSSDHDPVFVDLAIPNDERCEPSADEDPQRVEPLGAFD